MSCDIGLMAARASPSRPRAKMTHQPLTLDERASSLYSLVTRCGLPLEGETLGREGDGAAVGIPYGLKAEGCLSTKLPAANTGPLSSLLPLPLQVLLQHGIQASSQRPDWTKSFALSLALSRFPTK